MEEDERDDREEPKSLRKRKATTQELEIDVSAAEPPSKKALRKEKKKQSTPKADKSSQAISERTSAAAALESRKDHQGTEKSQYGIWMGNIPFTASKDDVKKFLTDNQKQRICLR